MPQIGPWATSLPILLLLVTTIAEPMLGDPTPSTASAGEDDGPTFYKDQVLPVLEEHCLRCHGKGSKLRGNLNLSHREGVLKGGDFGPAVDLEAPDLSLLLEAINYEGLEMPPSGKLDDDAIAILTRWVELGAPFDRAGSATPNNESDEEPEDPLVTDADRKFWSFQPIQRPPIPEVGSEPGWIRNPIDAFVLRQLNEFELTPAPPASKIALLRRLTFDLTGLPPTLQEAEAFLNDESPVAFEKLVDRLLGSPAYGERWGRHWLDVVRYAETNSFERDSEKPFSWRYRDYVIRAFNDDKPYNRFVTEQLAGDELADADLDAIIATGFYRLGAWDDEPTDRLQARYDELDDIITTVGQGFLGITINCARCHDHKIDPIPQADYYRFLGYFHNLKPYSYAEGNILTEIATEAERSRHIELTEQRKKALAVFEAPLKPLEEKILATVPEPRRTNLRKGPFERRRHVLDGMADSVLGPQELDEYEELIKAYKSVPQVPRLPQTLSAREFNDEIPETFVLIRGSAHAQGDRVEAGAPRVLVAPDPPQPATPAHEKSAGLRRALATWMTDPENPLTARVMVNRIWHYHFGRGIVRTPNDFGNQGAVPTHPELLDWLASEFIANGWSIKQLHRTILLSNTYRMSSRPETEALTLDPTNDLLSRFDMRRLEAEEIRDSLLAVTGRMNHQMGGKGFYSSIPSYNLALQSSPVSR